MKSYFLSTLKLLAALPFLFLLISFQPASAQTINGSDDRPWFKADLHTHHTRSDPLEKVIGKYKETGYKFLVLSNKDMHKPIDFEPYSTPEMRIVNGVEQAFTTRKNLLGHIIAFRIKKPYRFTSHWTLKEGYEKLRKKNKNVVMGVNHPHDRRWTIEDIMEARKEGLPLFELNSIDMKHGEFETALWDQALSKGARIYAMLTNDVHGFDDIDAYGYILIQAESLGMKHISASLHSGRFYAVEAGSLVKIRRHELIKNNAGTSLEVAAPGAALIRVIGDNGKLLSEYRKDNISHPLTDNESYIRVEIIDKNGIYIFMQPFFLKN